MKTVLIGIAGGTASGKTTIARKIFDASCKYGTVAMIRMDDYYKENNHLSLEDRQKINYDHPNAYDVDLLIKDLDALKKGQTIEKPTYDFVNHNRAEAKETVKPANVIILEGIMTFAITEVRSLCEIKIFVDTPDDIRFIRRLERDTKKRGRSVESIINQYLTTVRPMHLMFVENSKRYANVIIPEGGENHVAVDMLTTKIISLLRNS